MYICGKVTGEPPAACAANFALAQRAIEAQGHQAINPLTEVNDPGCEWQRAMKICISALMRADAIVLLPNYLNSRGATVERILAEMLDIPIYLYEPSRDIVKRFG